jgi:hypothetical protein
MYIYIVFVFKKTVVKDIEHEIFIAHATHDKLRADELCTKLNSYFYGSLYKSTTILAEYEACEVCEEHNDFLYVKGHLRNGKISIFKCDYTLYEDPDLDLDLFNSEMRQRYAIQESTNVDDIIHVLAFHGVLAFDLDFLPDEFNYSAILTKIPYHLGYLFEEWCKAKSFQSLSMI